MQAAASALMIIDITCTQTYKEPSLKNDSAATAAGMIQIREVPPSEMKTRPVTRTAGARGGELASSRHLPSP